MASRGLNLRRFLSASSLYAIGDLLTKSARFILIPYYVQVLTKEEVGTLGVVQAISIASWTLFAYGLGLAVPRFYFQYKDRADQVVSAIWWTRMGVALLPCLLLIGVSYASAPWIMPGIPVYLVALSIITGFLRAGFNIIESWYMIREQPVRYRTFTVLQFITTTLLIIYLVSGRQMGVAGVVIGELASFVAWTLISAYLLMSAGKPDFQVVAWRDLLRYCSTLLPHTFFMWAIAYSDRVILQQFVGLKDLGVYEIGHTLAAALSVAALAMRAAWLPNFFKRASEETGRREFAQTASYFCSIIFFVATALVVLAPEAMWIITGGGYEEAVSVMRVVVVGLIGQALFMGLNQPVLYEGRNTLLSSASLTAAAVNFGLNLWWIPRLGIMGAALSLLVSYAILAVIALLITRRYYKINWEWQTPLGASLLAVTAGFVGCRIPTMNLILAIVVKTLLLSVLLVALALLHRRHSRAQTERTDVDESPATQGSMGNTTCCEADSDEGHETDEMLNPEYAEADRAGRSSFGGN